MVVPGGGGSSTRTAGGVAAPRSLSGTGATVVVPAAARPPFPATNATAAVRAGIRAAASTSRGPGRHGPAAGAQRRRAAFRRARPPQGWAIPARSVSGGGGTAHIPRPAFSRASSTVTRRATP